MTTNPSPPHLHQSPGATTDYVVIICTLHVSLGSGLCASTTSSCLEFVSGLFVCWLLVSRGVLHTSSIINELHTSETATLVTRMLSTMELWYSLPRGRSFFPSLRAWLSPVGLLLRFQPSRCCPRYHLRRGIRVPAQHRHPCAGADANACAWMHSLSCWYLVSCCAS
jgi:hypothetical protein